MKLIQQRAGSRVETSVDSDDALIGRISRFNGHLSPQAVRDALLAGHAVHTSFNIYRRADHPATRSA